MAQVTRVVPEVKPPPQSAEQPHGWAWVRKHALLLVLGALGVIIPIVLWAHPSSRAATIQALQPGGFAGGAGAALTNPTQLNQANPGPAPGASNALALPSGEHLLPGGIKFQAFSYDKPGGSPTAITAVGTDFNAMIAQVKDWLLHNPGKWAEIQTTSGVDVLQFDPTPGGDAHGPPAYTNGLSVQGHVATDPTSQQVAPPLPQRSVGVRRFR
jgi:hypothetical protein